MTENQMKNKMTAFPARSDGLYNVYYVSSWNILLAGQFDMGSWLPFLLHSGMLVNSKNTAWKYLCIWVAGNLLRQEACTVCKCVPVTPLALCTMT